MHARTYSHTSTHLCITYNHTQIKSHIYTHSRVYTYRVFHMLSQLQNDTRSMYTSKYSHHPTRLHTSHLHIYLFEYSKFAEGKQISINNLHIKYQNKTFTASKLHAKKLHIYCYSFFETL